MGILSRIGSFFGSSGKDNFAAGVGEEGKNVKGLTDYSKYGSSVFAAVKVGSSNANPKSSADEYCRAARSAKGIYDADIQSVDKGSGIFTCEKIPF